MRNEDATSQHRGGDHPQQPPTLNVAEAAQLCGVSTSTIRRYLRGGRFPGARQDPSPVPGQPGHWRIPTDDLLQAGLDRRQPTPSGHAAQHQAPADRAGAWADMDRVQALEHALELERTRLELERMRRQAAEVLAAERARTIVTLEAALRALEDRRPEPAADQTETATAASSRSRASTGQAPGPGPPSGFLQLVPRPRRPRGELSQEERAAIIGRALSGQRPPKRRWGWW
jgi:transcriptional regulator with XRE-family HTH domain